MINNLRYADDTVIFAETEYELRHLMEREQKGLFLNITKSYTMVFSKSSSIPTFHIKVHGNPLEQVNSFIYHGSVFTSDGRCEKELKRRIEIAKTAFTSMKKVLCGRNIRMPVQRRVLKCYIWSTMLYGCETWTLSKGMMIPWMQQNTGFKFKKYLLISVKTSNFPPKAVRCKGRGDQRTSYDYELSATVKNQLMGMAALGPHGMPKPTLHWRHLKQRTEEEIGLLQCIHNMSMRAGH